MLKADFWCLGLAETGQVCKYMTLGLHKFHSCAILLVKLPLVSFILSSILSGGILSPWHFVWIPFIHSLISRQVRLTCDDDIDGAAGITGHVAGCTGVFTRCIRVTITQLNKELLSLSTDLHRVFRLERFAVFEPRHANISTYTPDKTRLVKKSRALNETPPQSYSK